MVRKQARQFIRNMAIKLFIYHLLIQKKKLLEFPLQGLKFCSYAQEKVKFSPRYMIKKILTPLLQSWRFLYLYPLHHFLDKLLNLQLYSIQEQI